MSLRCPSPIISEKNFVFSDAAQKICVLHNRTLIIFRKVDMANIEFHPIVNRMSGRVWNFVYSSRKDEM